MTGSPQVHHVGKAPILSKGKSRDPIQWFKHYNLPGWSLAFLLLYYVKLLEINSAFYKFWKSNHKLDVLSFKIRCHFDSESVFWLLKMNNLQGKAFVYNLQQHTIHHIMNKMNDYQWMNQTNQNASVVALYGQRQIVYNSEIAHSVPMSSFTLVVTTS